MGKSRNQYRTSDVKDVVITASTCGVTSLLGTIIFFFIWRGVGYFDAGQSLFMVLINGTVFSLIGGIVAGVTGIKIRTANQMLRRGFCGAIAGLFSMMAVEQIIPAYLFTPAGPRFPFLAFGLVSPQLFALLMGTTAGASAGSLSVLYIGKPAYHVSVASAAEGCALASFIWVLAASLRNFDLDAIVFTLAILGSGIIAILGAVIGAILGGLLGLVGHLIVQAENRALSSLVGCTCGAALGMIIIMIFLAGMFAQ